MKIDFNFILKGLDGKEIEDNNSHVNAGMLLGNLIASTSKNTDILKWMGWAQALYNCKQIDISENEKNEIKEFIKESQQLTILAKMQMLEHLDKAKMEADKAA
jgi:hypothetical protein